MSPLYAGINGVVRELKEIPFGRNGIMRDQKEQWAGINGVQRQIFSSGPRIGDLPVESIVKINENGAPVDYLIVHQGKPSDIYDESCNGAWLLRKEVLTERVTWADNNRNWYELSDIKSWLLNTMFSRYDTTVQNSIKSAKIPYHKGGGVGGSDQTGASGLASKVFLLSAVEVGFVPKDTNNYPEDGVKLDYFLEGTNLSAKLKRKASQEGGIREMSWALRSPALKSPYNVWFVNSEGASSSNTSDVIDTVRPAFILPSSFPVP